MTRMTDREYASSGARFLARKYGLSRPEAEALARLSPAVQERIFAEHERFREAHGLSAADSSLSRGELLRIAGRHGARDPARRRRGRRDSDRYRVYATAPRYPGARMIYVGASPTEATRSFEKSATRIYSRGGVPGETVTIERNGRVVQRYSRRSSHRDAGEPVWIVVDSERRERVVGRHRSRVDARNDAAERNRVAREMRFSYMPEYALEGDF